MLHRLRRLLQLIQLLQSGRIHNATQLADQCRISRRTVFRDLKMLQDAGLQLLYDESRQGYYMPSRSTTPVTQLTMAEAFAVLVICQDAAAPQTGIPFLEPAYGAMAKILASLPDSARERISESLDLVSIRVEPRNRLQLHQETFERIVESILCRTAIRVNYHSFAEQKNLSTLLHPYRLLFSRRSWYVIGRSSVHRAVRVFNLGRIRECVIVPGIPYQIPPRFSLQRFFGNAWHLIREPKAAATVVLRFRPKVAGNVAEVTWHKTQRTSWNEDGSLDLTVDVDGLSEIAWWILGYGDQAEVLSPPELRDRIAGHIRGMSTIYAAELARPTI